MSWVVRAPDSGLERLEKKLYTRVRRVLWDYEPLRASHAEIFIDIESDRVHLRGRVRTLPQKLIAAVLAERVAGVSVVTNALIADPDVISEVALELAHDERTAAYVIRVDSKHGIVTLSGQVPTAEVLQVAADIAASVPDVLTVRNRLSVGGDVLAPVSLPRPSSALAVTTPA